MAVEVTIQASDLPTPGARDENYLITEHEWRLARFSEKNLSKLYTSAEVSFLCQGEDAIVSRVTFAGIRISKEDVLRRIVVAGWSMKDQSDDRRASPTSEAVPPVGAVRTSRQNAPVELSRGTLPPNASAANRRDEAHAHAAAELVRSGVTLSEALRVVAPTDHTRAKESVEHAIRRTVTLMYDKNGHPL